MTDQTDTLSPEKACQILDGAVAIFSRDGYEGASMARIAASACVSKGTLYNYFDTKADLFAALINRQCKRHLAHIFDINDPDGDPATAMQAIGERLLRMIISDTGLVMHRLVVAEAPKFPALARIFHEAGPARAETFMSNWLARQSAAGRMCLPDPAFAAEQFFALCQTRLAYTRRLGLPIDTSEAAIQQVVRSAVTLFLNTYGASP